MEGIGQQPATTLPTQGMFPSICSGVKGAGDMLSSGRCQVVREVPQERDVMCLRCLKGGQKSFRQRQERGERFPHRSSRQRGRLRDREAGVGDAVMCGTGRSDTVT